MEATRFERQATVFWAAVSLAAAIAAFATGPVRAQPVTPPVPPQNPTFNPSTPNTVPQPPPAPVAPSLPAAPAGPSAVPNMPAILPPSSAAPPTNSTPTAERPAAEKPAASPAHAHRHGTVHGRWRHRHGRYHARPLGLAYYPGVGEFYPPYPHPCHMSEVWYGYYAPYWAYSCSW